MGGKESFIPSGPDNFTHRERKALVGERNGRQFELEMLIDTKRGRVAILLSPVGQNGGDLFGNHLWQQLSSERSRLEAAFRQINTVDEFYKASRTAMGHDAEGISE
ncbi:MAG: hypothetical protein OEY44_02375 [Candidatus Peregrinibacteria bacterium]|nr:hypothetical protein [Candidatus Peregrinibacteria bacterium]